MERIIFVSMPVADVNRPSISLTQLRSVMQRRHGERVSVEILYLNHDFASYLAEGRGPVGVDLSEALRDNTTGMGDWFFRQAAFPHLEDNTTAYFRRCYPGKTAEAWKDVLLERRSGVEGFLNSAIDRYRIDEARVVGFTSMFSQNVASFALARLLKERRPEVTVVMGGPNCETPMGQEIVKNVDQVDYVFSGPALVSFPEFVQCHLDGEMDKCGAINGVFSKAITDREGRQQIGVELDINEPVELDYSDFFESFEKSFPAPEQPPMMLFETSRGCWWGELSHCTFCGLNGLGMNYRAMAADKAIGLFRSLFDRYRAKSDSFHSVDNILPRNYVKEVLPFIKTPPDTEIFYEVKADLKEDALRVMSEAGVSVIQPGIESLATSTLALMEKGTSVFVNLRLLKNCLKYGITPAWNLLVGFPGEPEAVYEMYVRDIPRLAHLPPPEQVASVRFDRYSPYFVKAKEYGLKLRYFDFYSLVYPFDEGALDNLAYYFMDQNFDAAYMGAVAKWIGKVRAGVDRWRGRWNGQPGGTRPMLELEVNGDAARVRDSRTGEEIEHDISGPGRALLDYLERPRRAPDIISFGESQGIDAQDALRAFDERGFVWREGDRYMSLVTRCEP